MEHGFFCIQYCRMPYKSYLYVGASYNLMPHVFDLSYENVCNFVHMHSSLVAKMAPKSFAVREIERGKIVTRVDIYYFLYLFSISHFSSFIASGGETKSVILLYPTVKHHWNIFDCNTN